jgi:hypothetical protein
MEWNGIFGMKRRIDNQRFVKNAVLQYSNWNGMEWNTGCKNQKLHIPFWNGMEYFGRTNYALTATGIDR